MKKILLFCDQPLAINGFATLLENNIDSLIVENVLNFHATIEDLPNSCYDLIVFLGDSNLTTPDFFIHILKAYPLCPMLLIVENMASEVSMALYKHGILGILPFSASLDDIIMAIKQVMAGHFFMTNEFRKYMVTGYQKESMVASKYRKLTDREAEIASLILSGKRLSVIGNMMNLKVSTIGSFKSKIFKKLGVNSLPELASIIHHNKVLLQN